MDLSRRFFDDDSLVLMVFEIILLFSLKRGFRLFGYDGVFLVTFGECKIVRPTK